MPDSYLQGEFLRVFADSHKATAEGIVTRLVSLGVPPELHERVREIVQDEVRGLYHGSLVVFDGGSSLSDHGTIRIVDDEGTPFATNLHEIGFRNYDECV